MSVCVVNNLSKVRCCWGLILLQTVNIKDVSGMIYSPIFTWILSYVYVQTDTTNPNNGEPKNVGTCRELYHNKINLNNSSNNIVTHVNDH